MISIHKEKKIQNWGKWDKNFKKIEENYLLEDLLQLSFISRALSKKNKLPHFTKFVSKNYQKWGKIRSFILKKDQRVSVSRKYFKQDNCYWKYNCWKFFRVFLHRSSEPSLNYVFFGKHVLSGSIERTNVSTKSGNST
jgi:hypothetical protein